MGDYMRSNTGRTGPIGLSLGDEEIFLTYVRSVLNQNRGISESQVQNSLIPYQGNNSIQNRGISETQVQNSLIPYQENNNTIQVECNNTRNQLENTRASHMPALKLKIGSWQKETRSDGEVRLLAKFYYLKKRIIWEILEIKMGRKRKLEMRFDDILNMAAIFTKGRTSILRVELKRVPEMGIEKEPERGKHTIWIQEEDFTGGQAHASMIHNVEFEEGILEQHYEKLLIAEPRFRGISQLNPSYQHFNSSMEGSTFEQIRSNVGSLANHVNFNNPALNFQPSNNFRNNGLHHGSNEIAREQNVDFQKMEGPMNNNNNLRHSQEENNNNLFTTNEELEDIFRNYDFTTISWSFDDVNSPSM